MNKNLANSPFFNVILFVVFWAIQIFISKLAFLAGAEIIPFTVQSSFLALTLLSIYIILFKRKDDAFENSYYYHYHDWNILLNYKRTA